MKNTTNTKIRYYKKGVVGRWTEDNENSWNSPDSGVMTGDFKDVSSWSNLLESALNNEQKILESLASTATTQDIKAALSTLEETLKISTRYETPQNLIEVNGLPMHERGPYYRPLYDGNKTVESMMPDKIKQARINLLCCYLTTENKEYLNNFSAADKRLIEVGFKKMIEEVQNLDDAIKLYEKFNRAGVLEHQRNPTTFIVISAIFEPRYSRLKENIILACQKQVVILLAKLEHHSDINSDLFRKLKLTIFSPQHTQFGIPKNNEFDQIYEHIEREIGIENKKYAF